MRIFTFVVALISLIVFVAVLPHVVAVEQLNLPGLINPRLHIFCCPGREAELVTAFITMVFAWYIWFVVAWVEEKWQDVTNLVRSDDANADQDEPLALRALKEAIRADSVEQVRRQIDALNSLDAAYRPDTDYVTPLELADLYGNEEIIAILAPRFGGLGQRPMPVRNPAKPSSYD